MRLIDADELKKDIDGYDYSEEGYSDRMDFKFIYEVIDNQPTVEAKPVVHCRDCCFLEVCKTSQWLGLDGYCSRGEKHD